MTLKFNILFLLLVVLHISLVAQQPAHFNFTTEDGLPTNRIYDIMQDSKGYIWAGTHDGVVRFNGKEFKTYNSSESLNYEYSYLQELKDGSIWCINFGNQVFKVSGDSLKPVEALEPFINDRKYFKLHSIKDSIIILETRDRIVYHNPTLNETKNVTFDSSLDLTYIGINENHLLTLYRDANTRRQKYKIYDFYGEEFIMDYDIEKRRTRRIFNNENTIFIHEFPFKNNTIGEFYQIEINNDKIIESEPIKLKPNTNISSITKISDKEIWVSTNSGTINIATGKSFYEENQTTRVIKDNLNGYWISTYNNGIIYIPNINNEKVLDLTNGIERISELDSTTLLLGSSDGYLYFYDILNNKIIDKTFISKSNSGRHFLNKDKDLYVSMHYKIKGEKSNLINNIYPLDVNLKRHRLLDDEHLLLLSGKDVLFCQPLNKENKIKYKFSDQWIYSKEERLNLKTIEPNIENLYKYNNQIWIAFDNSIYIEENEQFTEFKDNEGNSLRVNAFIGIDDKKIMLSDRESGIHIVKNNKIESYISNDIYKKFGTINKLIKTDNGIAGLTKKGILLMDYDGKIQHTIDETDQFIGSTINDIFYSNNSLWVGTTNGIYKIPTATLEDNSFPTAAYINSFIINGEEVKDLKGDYTFSHNSDIEFYFEGPTIKGRNSFHYEYKLNNTEDWKMLSNNSNSIRFPNISSGYYNFKVRIINEEGIPGTPSEVKFRILPPIWQRWWFILGTLFILGFIGFLLYRNQLQRIEKENKLEQEIRSNKLSALQSRMNPHFIFNSLNSIQDFIIKLDREGANDYLGTFSDLMRVYLKHSEKDKVELFEEIEALEMYLKLEQLRFNDIKINFEVNPELDKFDILIPPLFIQPYVENVFKHGLLHKVGEKKIDVIFDISENKDNLIINIIDNGVGRKRVAEIKEKSIANGLSYSTKANETRLELLNHNRTNKILVNIVDLYDKDLALGTQVIITIPIMKF